LKNSQGSQNYPQFTQNPADITANAGSNVTFNGAATPAGVAYQWRKDAADISAATSSSLSLNTVSAANAGVYTLIASNANGTAASRGARLTIRQAPAITQQPQPITAQAGSQVALDVTATGTDPLQYQWSRNNQPVAGATNHRLIFVTLGG